MKVGALTPDSPPVRKSLHSPAQDRLLALLREARRRAGLTQTEVAERLGKPQSYVAKVEGGERRLDTIEMIAFAQAIGADPVRIVRAVMQEMEQP